MALSLDDFLRLPGHAQSLRREYLNAKPWPHIVVEGIFPEGLLDSVAAECAGLDQARLIRSNDYRQIKQEASEGLGPATKHLLEIVEGESFREFVSAVTGVADLLPDPMHKFAGAHRTPPGGFTKIHRDFEVHPTSGLFHRVNLLVYLNRDWADSYGGTLNYGHQICRPSGVGFFRDSTRWSCGKRTTPHCTACLTPLSALWIGRAFRWPAITTRKHAVLLRGASGEVATGPPVLARIAQSSTSTGRTVCAQ
jgi:hypothetical protein